MRLYNKMENKLEITKNKKGYDEIKLERMSNDDFVIVEKVFDTVKMFTGEKVYKEGEPAKTWTLYTTRVIYNGNENVGVVFPKLHSAEDKIVNPDELVEIFDSLGGAGAKVKITCTKTMGAAAYDFGTAFKKGNDIVKVDLKFEAVE